MTRLILSLVLLSAACAAPSRSVRFGDRVLPKEGVCSTRVYGEGERPKKFLVVGRVEAESEADKSRLRIQLEQEACRLGADALIDLRQDSLPTVRSSFDEQTRETTLGAGPTLHIASALAVSVQDDTPVKAVSACPACAAAKPCPPERTCSPCPTCKVCSEEKVESATPAEAATTPAPEAKAAETKAAETKAAESKAAEAKPAAKTEARPAAKAEPKAPPKGTPDPILGELPPLIEE